jgi:hypothetical protein
VRDPPVSDLGGENPAESVPPKPDRLMADVDPALGQEFLGVDSGYFTYISSARRIISGELLK